MTESAPLRRLPRVIHIVESLDIGAVESWLLRMLEASHKFGEPVDWTFYTVLGRPGRFDEEAIRLGATVIHSPVELNEKIAFVRNLRDTLRQGNYDVMHSHHDVLSAVYLIAAAGLGIGRRIVHVHNADLSVPTGSATKSALLREPMRQMCLRFADKIVGVSRYALANFLQYRAIRAGRDLVVHCAIDTTPFHEPPPDLASIRRNLNLPEDSRILLFASRMVSYKNPMFVLEILTEIASSELDVYAVFVGVGPLEDELRDRARDLGLESRVRVLGWRSDTVPLMRASNLLVFPRVERETADVGREGLGLVVVEAQAAGLMSLLSLAIPDDAIVVPLLCERQALDDGSAAWSATVSRLLAHPKPDQGAALATIERSPFALEAGFRNLVALHQP